MKQLFMKTVLPSVLAFAFSGVYAIVDGFFIGKEIGDMGLAAINIAYPITALIQAVGTGIGMGGAIVSSISQGRGEEKRAARYRGNTLTLLIGISLTLTAGLWISCSPLLQALGAGEDTLALARQYIQVIILGASFQILSTGLIPIFRNLGQSMLAMLLMSAGFITNAALDYLMVSVWQMGMAGAAWATVIGQAVTAVPCAALILSRRYREEKGDYRLKGKVIGDIATTGLSPFGLTLSPNLVLVLMNRAALAYGGTRAVSAYAIASYILCIIQLLAQGVGDGSQPLMSRFAGENRPDQVKAICRLAFGLGLALAVSGSALVIIGRNWLPSFFGGSAEATQIASQILFIFAVGFWMVAVNRVTTSYLYSMKNNRAAYVMVYGEPIALAALLLIIPRAMGLTGVWLSVPLTQCLLMGTGWIVYRQTRRLVSAK